MLAFSSKLAPSQKLLPSIAAPAPRQAAVISRVTARSGGGDPELGPGAFGSRSSEATPPNIHSVIYEIPILLRIAITA